MSVQEEMEVENAEEWEIHFLSASKNQGQTSMITSSPPAEEEIEWANLRMVTLQMAQCSHHPDEGLEEDVSSLQALLSQPSWSTPSMKAESEYVNNVEGILAELTDPLRVVYNVDPSEARSNLGVWKDALVKELDVVSSGGSQWRISERTATRRTRR